MAGDLSSLLGMSQDDLNAIMQQLQPSDEDKRLARQQALLQASAGLLGNMYKPTGMGIAAGMQGGLLGYNQSLKEQTDLRKSNLTQALAIKQASQQAAAYAAYQKELLGGGQPQTQPGPPQAFQQPGGAAAMMDAGVNGNPMPAPNALPTQVQLPNAGPNRERLARLNLLGMNAGMKDNSGALKFMFPDQIPLRAGADVLDPSSGQIQPGAPAIPGYYWDRAARQYVKASGAAQAQAEAAAIPKAVGLAYDQQTGMLPGGGEGIVGNKLDATFPRGAPLPYGAPQPFPTKIAPQVQAQRDQGRVQILTDEYNANLAAPPSDTRDRNLASIQAELKGMRAPVPSGPVQTKLSPEQNRNSEDLGAERAAMREATNQSMKAQAQLGQIKDTLKYFTPGPSLPARSAIAGYAQELPVVGRSIADALVPNSATALPAIAAMEKFGVGLTAEQSKVFGSREGQQVIGMIKSAMPHAGQVPGAPETIIDAQNGVHQWIIDKGQAAERWAKDHNDSIAGFSDAWDASHPIGEYVKDLPAIEAIAAGKQVPTGTPNTTALYKARQAIKAGADPAAVKQRLQQSGFSTQGL